MILALAAVGCRQDMHDQPRIEPLEAHAFFADGMGSRRPPAGTVARGLLRQDSRFWQGKDEAGAFVEELPVELDRALLERGRQRFDIFCGVCHDAAGSGRGMIVRRGFKQPPPLYEDRLLAMPAGYFFDVMTQGFGVMSSYARQLPAADRWAVVAYIRALQTARSRTVAELPPAVAEEFHAALLAAETAAAEAAAHEAGETAAHGTGEEHH